VIVRRLFDLNWVAVVIAPLAVILMEAFCVYPWLVWLGKWQGLVWQRPPLNLASLIFLLGFSFLVTRYFIGRKWHLRLIQLSIILCGLLSIFIVVRLEYGAGFELFSRQWFIYTAQVLVGFFVRPHPIALAIIVGLILWWRGIRRGRSPLHFSGVYHSFLGGIAALVLLFIFWRISLEAGSVEDLASISPYVAAFFFFGLAALALLNLNAIQQRMLSGGGRRLLNYRWLLILFGVVASIVLVGIGVASIFSTEFVAFLGNLIGSTFKLMGQVLYYLLIPLGYMAEGLLYVAQFLINLFRSEEPVGEQEIPESARPELPTRGEPSTFPDVAVEAIKWTLFAIAAAVVIFLLARAIFRYRASRAGADVDEIHESLWSWGGFKADLNLFFSMLRQRFSRKKKEISLESAVPDWYTEDDFQGVLSIREIYKHLLWKASGFGIARRHSETPYEYASRLGKAVPEGSTQLGELTSLYVDARYGDLKTEDKQVGYANRLWKAFRGLLGKLGGDQREQED